jgi:hypothetical protein
MRQKALIATPSPIYRERDLNKYFGDSSLALKIFFFLKLFIHESSDVFS